MMERCLFLLLPISLTLMCVPVKAENISKAQRNKETIMKLASMENEHLTSEAIETLFTKDAVIEVPNSITTVKTAFDDWALAFPDRKTKIVNIIAQNNYVFDAAVITGTQTGLFWGIAPTNKKITKVSYNIFTFNDAGKIVQFSQQWNEVEVMKQLGYIVL